MHKIAQTLSVVILLGSASGVMADDPKSRPIVPAAARAAAAECPEGTTNCQLVCKTFAPPTGTRLGGHTECRTRQFWEDRMREDQARTVKIQEDSYKYVTPGN